MIFAKVGLNFNYNILPSPPPPPPPPGEQGSEELEKIRIYRPFYCHQASGEYQTRFLFICMSLQGGHRYFIENFQVVDTVYTILTYISALFYFKKLLLRVIFYMLKELSIFVLLHLFL